jgi:UDP-2,4-diacetamido-2,4,6-trideoxy-beta-L-altropyranose hydrolase
MGTGHVLRCLALAEAWQDGGGKVIFAIAQSTVAVEALLRSKQVGIAPIHARPGSSEDARNTIEAARTCGADWMVVDGYDFHAHFQAELQSFRPLLAIDDNGLLESYAADLVLNQNAHACEEMYARRTKSARLLLGPLYALLRNEFVAYRDWLRDTPGQGSKILLTMGGSDPGNLTPRLLPRLAVLPEDDLRIRVVVGGSAENSDAVATVAEKFSGRVELLHDVRNMADLMAWADLAISGAGTTCWEMCFMGLPAVLVVVAENQRLIAERLATIGAAQSAGNAETIDCGRLAELSRQLLASKERRLLMSQMGRQLVDGRGRDRVLESMKQGDHLCD